MPNFRLKTFIKKKDCYKIKSVLTLILSSVFSFLAQWHLFCFAFLLLLFFNFNFCWLLLRLFPSLQGQSNVCVRLRLNYISSLYIWPFSRLAVLGILIPSATFLAWKKFSRELPASSSVTIPANQASLACWVPWIGHYSLSITSINFLFKASQNPDDRGLSKYIYLCNSCTRCSHIKFNHLSGQSNIFKLSFSPRTIPKHMEVIFTENRDKAARIVNGQQATILGCENNTIILSLPEGQRVFVYPVTHLDNDTHTTRYPFSPAYAQTITKSQGRNIRHLIIWLDCDTVPPGTGYVGLSRVRARSSISLLQPIRTHQLDSLDDTIFSSR